MNDIWIKPIIAGGSLVFAQDTDGCQDSSVTHQTLTVKFEDGGAGLYAVMKTPRWAIDSADDIRPILDLTSQVLNSSAKMERANRRALTKRRKADKDSSR